MWFACFGCLLFLFCFCFVVSFVWLLSLAFSKMWLSCVIVCFVLIVLVFCVCFLFAWSCRCAFFKGLLFELFVDLFFLVFVAVCLLLVLLFVVLCVLLLFPKVVPMIVYFFFACALFSWLCLCLVLFYMDFRVLVSVFS